MELHNLPSRAPDLTVALVVAGGAPVDPSTVADLPGTAWVIAADSGLDRALDLGWPVDVVVGDLDSISPAALAAADAAKIEIIRHPPMKDQTDLELAIALAVERGVRRVVVVGLSGWRFDHLLANALLLAAPELAGVEVEGRFDESVVHVVRRSLVIEGAPGELVTLLPVHGPAFGVSTEGLRYALDDETLEPGSSRGVSNQIIEREARVSLREGVLLAITPRIHGPSLGPDLSKEK